MGRTPARLAVLAACIGLGVAGCAGVRIEDGVFYGRNYRVVLPRGWQVSPDGRADLALSRRDQPGGMLVNATCQGRERERTLAVLGMHLLFGLRDRRVLERAQITLGGEPAERMVFEGKSVDESPVRGEAYVIKGADCVWDLVYVAPPEFFQQGRADFDRFVQSWRRP